MPSDIDILMARIGEINAKPATDVVPADIPVLVAYHRYNRSRRVAGYKPPKTDAEPKVDVLKVLGVAPKPTRAPIFTGTLTRRC